MEALRHLGKASSPQIIESVFLRSFQTRGQTIGPQDIKEIAEALAIEEKESKEVLEASRHVVSEALYQSMTAEAIVQFLPKKLHKEDDKSNKLKALIAKILVHHLPAWRSAAINSQVALSRLENIDGRIDVMNASDKISRMNVPTVIVQLKVQDTLTKAGGPLPSRNIIFELNKGTIETMLDGLGKIRDQLQAIKT